MPSTSSQSPKPKAQSPPATVLNGAMPRDDAKPEPPSPGASEGKQRESRDRAEAGRYSTPSDCGRNETRHIHPLILAARTVHCRGDSLAQSPADTYLLAWWMPSATKVKKGTPTEISEPTTCQPEGLVVLSGGSRYFGFSLWFLRHREIFRGLPSHNYLFRTNMNSRPSLMRVLLLFTCSLRSAWQLALPSCSKAQTLKNATVYR